MLLVTIKSNHDGADHIGFFFKKKLEDMSPFCAATDTPVLDF